ncbi:hypothetical protein OS493_033187 [Desmophyllum pertusum]|uniref:Uncharacterized protein n=1 Tax=Desmophyllum pertusum TaxID=174260 RepID=A0A9X0CCY8_9CNID|nr:hypothetical protein OS493_033187 [Desmophyllum pertusum]
MSSESESEYSYDSDEQEIDEEDCFSVKDAERELSILDEQQGKINEASEASFSYDEEDHKGFWHKQKTKECQSDEESGDLKGKADKSQILAPVIIHDPTIFLTERTEGKEIESKLLVAIKHALESRVHSIFTLKHLETSQEQKQ